MSKKLPFKLVLFVILLFGQGMSGQNYVPMKITSGFNADVIANGVGPVTSSTTHTFDLSTFNLVSSDFLAQAGDSPLTFGLPVDGRIVASNDANLIFQLNPYSQNNSLRLINWGSTGDLVFETPENATQIEILTAAGNAAGSPASFSGEVRFTDNTIQSFSGLYADDWYSYGVVSPTVTYGMGRVRASDNVLEKSTNFPRLFGAQINISVSNYYKKISSIHVFKTSSTPEVLHIMAVTVKKTPDCFQPTNVQVNKITTNQATISWSAAVVNPDLGYAYEIRTSGLPGSGMSGLVASGIVSNSTLSQDILNLTPSTTYFVYVRSRCTATSFSDWSLSTKFETACLPPTVTTVGNSSCNPGSVTLTATTTDGVLRWYDSPTSKTVLTTGGSYTTPVLTATKSYWVDATSLDFISLESGKKALHTSANNVNTFVNWGIIFDLTHDVYLKSTDVFVGAPGTLNVAIYDSSGTEITSTGELTVNALGTLSPVTIPLNVQLKAGFGYRLLIKAFKDVRLYRDSMVSFPYKDASETLSVSSGFFDGYTRDYYYYFYNLVFEKGCTSPRTEVVATVTDVPTFTLSETELVLCKGASSGAVTLASGAVSNADYTWLPATGVSGDAQKGWVFNPTVSTTYQLTASVNGCEATQEVVVQVIDLTLTSSQTNIKCQGASTGTATVDVSGGTPPYTYAWDTNPMQTDQTAMNLTAGSYTVTITDKNGCTIDQKFIITEPTALSVTPEQTNIKCQCASTGMAGVTVTGGVAPYTYAWDNGATTASIDQVAAGTYTVTITDKNGCTIDQKFTITEPTALSVTPEQTDLKCQGASTGTATVDVSGGTPPYTYAWDTNPIQIDKKATNLVAGIYTVTITDKNGCIIDQKFTITEPTALSVTPEQTNIKCQGASTGTAAVTVSGGVAPYTYAWDNGATTAAIDQLAADIYTVTITDKNGCTITQKFTITEPTALSVAPEQTDVKCQGASTGIATVHVSGGTPPYTYAWDNGATTAAIDQLAAGTYTVTITDKNGCTIDQKFTITESTALSVTPEQTDVKCQGASTGIAAVTVTGGVAPYTYAWDNGATTASIDQLGAGTYTVTITDKNGCTITQKFTITEPTALSVTPTQTDVKCHGASTGMVAVTVSGGTPPYTYAWDNGATTAAIDQVAAGSYTVTITDKNGCTIDQKFTITESTALSVTPEQTNIKCQGASTGIAAVAVTGGVAPYTYAWDNGATTTAIDQLAAGSYTVTITDKNGCTTTEKFTITEPTALSVIPKQTNAICYGASTGTATVDVSGGTPPYTYAWDNGATTAAIDQLAAGTYTVTITDKNGCTTTEKFTITEPAKVAVPEVQAIVVYTYGDLATPLTATALSGNTLQWYTSATGGTADNHAPTPSTTAVGTQQYWVSQRTAAGCESDRQPIEVQIKKAQLQVVVNSGQNKMYGSLDGVLSYTATGFKATDTATVFSGALVRQAGENVGTYLITQGSLQAGPNYEIILETAHFTITPAPLTVHPNPGQTKVYGSANPIYSYSVSGFVSGDTMAVITGLLDRQKGESVGLYSYQVGTLATVHHNYTFTIAAENFSITPATITVQANAGQSKTYGTKDPVFTYTVTGLVNGDTKAVFSGSLQRVVGEDVGLYAIEQGSLKPNSNYQLIQFTGSEFQIVKARITGLQLKDKTVVYDGTVHSLVVGGNSITGALITYTGNNQVNVGTYPITARIDYGSNYEILELKATLRITPAEQHLVFEVASPLVLEDTPPFALNAVASSGLTVAYTYAYIENEPATISTTGQVILFTPGIVEITAHQSGNNNYKTAESITRRLVIHSKDSSIWTLEVDGESFEKPSKNTLVVRGCEKAAGDVVEIRVTTQLGATVLPSAVILVQTPEYGTYKQDIEIVAEDGIHRETYTVIIEKRMPWEGVLLQKYDNLVFVNNNPATNGGYTFSKYEWYKNGQKVAEKQVFSEGPTSSDQLDPAAEYYAVLYTTKGKVFVTCPMGMKHKNTYAMTVYPNPVGKNQPLNVRFDYPVDAFKTSEYTIYNTIGQFITKGQLEHAVSVIDLPFDVAAGTYILVLKVDGAYKSVRFVVK